MEKVYRDVRLHYGGVFVENSTIPGLDIYDWVGGYFVDVRNVTLDSQTLHALTNLFKLHCPLHDSMNLRFFYMVGGIRFELDKDMEVHFAWSICSKNNSDDILRNIYCLSDLVVHSPSQSKAISANMSQSMNEKEVESLTTSDETNDDVRLCNVQELEFGPNLFHNEDNLSEDIGPEDNEDNEAFDSYCDDMEIEHENNFDGLNQKETDGNINFEEFNEEQYEENIQQSYQPTSNSHDPTDSESDSEYAPTDFDETDHSDDELDPEDAAEQAECLPELKDFIHKTFDCTEENPCEERTVRFKDDIQLFVGQEWKTIQESRDFMRIYCIKKKFEIKFKVNNGDKLICICKAPNCPWRCYIRRSTDGYTAICKSITSDHNCVNDGNNKNCQATSEWIAKMIEDEIKRHHKSFTGKDIIKLVWHRFNVTIDYWKAWYAKGKALENLYGNYESSYGRIPDLCQQILQTNPGSVVQWEADSENKFMYCCVGFKASFDGWRRACRPIVGLDGCFLSGKYRGACLVATGMDANNGLFPLVYFICRKEEGDNWNKFLEIISPELKKHPLPLTVTSDRAPSLLSAIETYLAGCNYRSCFRHIIKSMSKYWRGEALKLKAYCCARGTGGGRGLRGGARGGGRSSNTTTVPIQPTAMSRTKIQLPPLRKKRADKQNEGTSTKRRKIFHPPSQNYLP